MPRSVERPAYNSEFIAEITFNLNNTTATLMNQAASEAMIRSTENQFAIPAQEATKQAIEKTKRAEEETKRFKLRVIAYPPVLAIGIIAMVIARDQPPVCMWIALAMIGVLGSVEGVQALDRYFSMEKKP